jgi:hypothetical protein
MVEQYLHSPILLHRAVLDYLWTETTLPFFCETKPASQLIGMQCRLRRDRMTRLQNRLAQQQSLLETSALQSEYGACW